MVGGIFRPAHLVILVIVLIIFGLGNLTDQGSSLGKAIRAERRE